MPIPGGTFNWTTLHTLLYDAAFYMVSVDRWYLRPLDFGASKPICETAYLQALTCEGSSLEAGLEGLNKEQ